MPDVQRPGRVRGHEFEIDPWSVFRGLAAVVFALVKDRFELGVERDRAQIEVDEGTHLRLLGNETGIGVHEEWTGDRVGVGVDRIGIRSNRSLTGIDRNALEVRTRQALPVEWAATQHILANAYVFRIRGE